MGFDKNGVRLLLHAQKQGINFAKTITIGRQGMHLSNGSLAENLREFGLSAQLDGQLLDHCNGFSENFLKLLGADQPESLDASDYEQATHVHDMNMPVPDHFRNQYSVVIDGGSLEHVFNFPVAIKNCMEMVQPGGHFIAITPCNNNMGHGFYQFSPELFYRVFSPANGFTVREMIFYTDAPKSTWYSVADPDMVKSRVSLFNSYSAYLFVVAQKTADLPMLTVHPQQSDYQASWSAGKSETSHLTANNSTRKAGISLPSSLRWWLLRMAYRLKIMKSIWTDTGSGNTQFFRVKQP